MRTVLLLALVLGAAAGMGLVVAVEIMAPPGMPRRYYDYPDGGTDDGADTETDARRRERAERTGAWMQAHPGWQRAALFGVGALPVALGVGVVGGGVVAVKRAKARRRAG